MSRRRSGATNDLLAHGENGTPDLSQSFGSRLAFAGLRGADHKYVRIKLQACPGHDLVGISFGHAHLAPDSFRVGHRPDHLRRPLRLTLNPRGGVEGETHRISSDHERVIEGLPSPAVFWSALVRTAARGAPTPPRPTGRLPYRCSCLITIAHDFHAGLPPAERPPYWRLSNWAI